jgi:hypothetical protein
MRRRPIISYTIAKGDRVRIIRPNGTTQWTGTVNRAEGRVVYVQCDPIGGLQGSEEAVGIENVRPLH